MKVDKSKISVKLEKWTIRNLYEILDYTEIQLTNDLPANKRLYEKYRTMLDAMPYIRNAIVEALKAKEKGGCK